MLAISSFRALWFGQICSQLAANTLLFVLALAVYQATGKNTAVSALFLSYGVPAVLFGLIAGTAVDHLDKRRVLIYCDLVRAILTASLVFISGNIFLVYGITFVNAVITQLYVPSEAPTIPRLAPPHLIVPANSLFSFTFYTSLAVGSVLAGPLLRLAGSQAVFLIISFFFGVAAWNESRLPSQAAGTLGFTAILRHKVADIVRRVFSELMDGLRYVAQRRVLSDSLLLLTGTQIILVMLGTLGPGFADRVLEVDFRDASLLIVGPAVLGIIVGAIWVGMVGFKFKTERLIRVGILGAGIMLLLISLTVRLHRVPEVSWLFGDSVRLPLVFTLFFLLGVANSFLDVPANSVLQEEAKGSMRGRVYGILTAAVGGVGVLPVLVGGILADVVGVGKVVFALGFLVLSYGVWRMKYNR
ncbi:MAG: Major facilitator superfamily [Candidatus Gottesmanbacteria bacterium GW2011_GWB1_49_7]|uniref:Major facilitator superfamily n=1 Tax=Candidatus Gottesmanbacteria bacterium GW2011_GWB1_49_7 TaxID=1618448 RepID=A0A0G1VYT1_9BACT|nr:MAG: Major facilitator superfamily [Candidatus Gottesmanbacteria bacterium GW2011_GWB1_49_7]